MKHKWKETNERFPPDHVWEGEVIYECSACKLKQPGVFDGYPPWEVENSEFLAEPDCNLQIIKGIMNQ